MHTRKHTAGLGTCMFFGAPAPPNAPKPLHSDLPPPVHTGSPAATVPLQRLLSPRPPGLKPEESHQGHTGRRFLSRLCCLGNRLRPSEPPLNHLRVLTSMASASGRQGLGHPSQGSPNICAPSSTSQGICSGLKGSGALLGLSGTPSLLPCCLDSSPLPPTRVSCDSVRC